MTETATIKNANSTIGAFTPAAEPAVVIEQSQPVVETPVETGTSSVDTSGQLQTDAPPVEAQPVQEANESSFSIGFDDEPAQTVAQPAQTQSNAIDWREAIKAVDKKEIAKQLGISDFALEIDEHLSRGGNAVDYLNAKAIDYTKVNDIDLLKNEFQKKYSFLSQEEQSVLFNDKYGINELDEDDAKARKTINQKIDAAEIRQKKIEEQSKFKFPENKTPQEQNQELVQMQTYLQQQQTEAEKAKQYISSHPSVQNLLNSKRVAIELGDGVKAFNYNVDKPELILKAIVDGSFYRKVITNEKGELDVEKLLRITKYAFNPERHDKDMFNYGKSHGVKSLVEEGQNAKRPDGKSIIPSAVTEAEAWKNPKSSTIGAHFKLR